MALVQALVIVAAIAAVSAALLLRADQARQRLETRFAADQAALYLDAGADVVRDGLPRGLVHGRQDWASPRAGVVIDRGVLAWRIDDLQGRFNLGWLEGDTAGTWRAAFVRLARGQGVTDTGAQRIATFFTTPGATFSPAVTRQMRRIAPDEGPAVTRLLPLVAALPPETTLNINTVLPEVLAAIAPGVPGMAQAALLRRVAAQPAEEIAALLDWADRTLGPDAVDVLSELPLDVTSVFFEIRLDVRVDTMALRRSVVVDTGGAEGRSTLLLSMPEPE